MDRSTPAAVAVALLAARPHRLPRWTLCALLATSACGRGGHAPPPRLAQGDSVQLTARQLGPGWHAATVGQAGDCTALMVPDPSPPAPPVRFVVVSFDSVTALRRGGADLPVDPLREAYGGCSPF